MIGSLENAPSHALEEPESTQGQSLRKLCMAVSAMLRVIWENKNATQKPAQVNAHILRPIIQYLYYSLNVSCWNNLWWKLCFLVIHCEWDEWVVGACSAECGVGTRTNTRVKLVEELNGGTCTGQPEEIEECMDVECPGEKFSDPCIIGNVIIGTLCITIILILFKTLIML